MTTYLAPCGISILDNLRSGIDRPRGMSPIEVDDAVEELTNWTTECDPASDPVAAVLARFRARFAAVAEIIDLVEWPATISAEVSTLAARTGGPDHLGGLVTEGHHVVLLGSATANGMLSALLVATYLARGDSAQVTIAATPEDLPGPDRVIPPPNYPLEPGTVTVIRVACLRPNIDDQFRRATFGIGHVMRAVQDNEAARGDEKTIEVHLTGGHKATLLQTLSLAEILRSTAAAQDINVSAWYLFEEMARNPGARAEPIGLRQFDDGTLRRMRSELEAVLQPHVVTQPGLLRGIAWTRDGELNAFGWGYRALLGSPTSGMDGQAT